jgi:hypothetical protein
MCKIWYLISRTVSDEEAHCGDMMIGRPRFRRQARASGAPPYAALGLTARRGQANPATVPLMHSLRCSVIKVHVCRTTSDRSSAGFLK